MIFADNIQIHPILSHVSVPNLQAQLHSICTLGETIPEDQSISTSDR